MTWTWLTNEKWRCSWNGMQWDQMFIPNNNRNFQPFRPSSATTRHQLHYHSSLVITLVQVTLSDYIYLQNYLTWTVTYVQDSSVVFHFLVLFVWLCLFFVVVFLCWLLSESLVVADDGRKGWKFRLLLGINIWSHCIPFQLHLHFSKEKEIHLYGEEWIALTFDRQPSSHYRWC